MIYPADFESRLGFDRIRKDIRNIAISGAARQMVDEINFSTVFQEIEYEIERTHQMRNCIMMESSFPTAEYCDTRFLSKARAIGNYLKTDELVILGQALEIIGSLKKFFTNDNNSYPLLKAMAEPVDSHPEVLREIQRIIDPTGAVRDNASTALSTIRRELIGKSGQISHRLQQILRAAQSNGYAEPEAMVSIRDGRAVIPVNAGNKRKVAGFVHSESATGKTAYIEPIEVVELNNELRELELAEKHEIIRILSEFTDNIRELIDPLIEAGEYVATVDFIAAKARYAIQIGATRPILENQRRIMLRKARHPILEKNLKAEGKSIMPLDLNLSTEKHILLISGPNAGGKSVCLKTVGLLQYMVQCGLLVPLLENSEIGIFDSILLDIGDQQSLDNDLSTYSSHLLNMKVFLKNATKDSLVLIDEFGGGTEPNIGGAIAEAVLEQLRSRGVFGVITTHYANLKYYGTAAQGIENGAMTFDIGRITPLFSLEQGRAGSSFALEIARKIGLPEEILQSAQEKIGVDQVNIEKQLRDAARDKRYWESKRDRIRQTEKGVERTAEQYTQALATIKEERSQLIKAARNEATRIISEANRQIENTIREIRESQADKERTRAVRDSFNTFKEGINSQTIDSDDIIAAKMARIQEQQERRRERALRRNEQAAVESEKPTNAVKVRPIEVGTAVHLEGQTAIGNVAALNGNRAQVAFGSVTTQVDKRRLVAATPDQIRKANTVKGFAAAQPTNTTANFSTMQRRLDFRDNIDLRGMRGAEALELVKLFIDDALMLGVGSVRILHGKGTGALKQQIRDYLSSERGVLQALDAPEDMGGAGITVVTLG